MPQDIQLNRLIYQGQNCQGNSTHLYENFQKDMLDFTVFLLRGARQVFSESRDFKWPIAREVQIVRPNMTSL